jgi:hypothetical protein
LHSIRLRRDTYSAAKTMQRSSTRSLSDTHFISKAKATLRESQLVVEREQREGRGERKEGEGGPGRPH